VCSPKGGVTWPRMIHISFFAFDLNIHQSAA